MVKFLRALPQEGHKTVVPQHTQRDVGITGACTGNPEILAGVSDMRLPTGPGQPSGPSDIISNYGETLNNNYLLSSVFPQVSREGSLGWEQRQENWLKHC